MKTTRLHLEVPFKFKHALNDAISKIFKSAEHKKNVLDYLIDTLIVAELNTFNLFSLMPLCKHFL